jgi:hypothetical protein
VRGRRRRVKNNEPPRRLLNLKLWTYWQDQAVLDARRPYKKRFTIDKVPLRVKKMMKNVVLIVIKTKLSLR